MTSRVTPAAWRAIALVSAIFAAGVSGYLLVEYTTGQPGICLTGSGCDVVRDSDFAYPLGVPMPLYGLAYDLVAAGIVYRTLGDRPLLGFAPARLLLGLSLAGAAVSVALTAIEAFVIGAFCSWCLAQAVANLVLFAAAVGLAVSSQPEPPEHGTRRERSRRARELVAEGSGIRRVGLASGSLTLALFAGLLVAGAGSGSTSVASPGASAALATEAAPQLGNGPVTVVEFADFQCPACASTAPILYQLATNDEITLVARYFPLTSIHANALASARAAAAANLQGQYWPMAERLYAEQGSWEGLSPSGADAYFAAMAGDLGLDVARWSNDYASNASIDAVNADRNAALQLGLPGTPSIFVGNAYYTGALSLSGLRAAIAQAAAGG